MTNKLPVVGKRYKLKSKNIIVKVLPIVTVVDELVGSTKEYGIEIFNSIYEELPEDKTETKPETQSSELNPEVKEAMEGARQLLQRIYTDREYWRELLADTLSNLLRALDKQFMSKKENKIDIKQECVDSVKVSETSESVDIKEEEVKENPKEQHFLAKIDYIRNAQINLSRNLEKISQDIMKEKILKNSSCFSKEDNLSDKKSCLSEGESIWKPVSELPYNYARVILKIKAGSPYYLEAFFKDNEFYDEELRKFFDNLPVRKERIKKWCYRTGPLKDFEKLKERDKQKEIRLSKLEERVKKLESK